MELSLDQFFEDCTEETVQESTEGSVCGMQEGGLLAVHNRALD
jgi:hypothetical protein